MNKCQNIVACSMKYPQLVSMPTEISDWLEEQLEARGIDALVYTRYILSLLYSDPVDVACPDQDLLLTQSNKEVRRSASGRKRFRCFSEWRHYAQLDAEQLKRTAAIECLMSASDQNWEIESLVDQLCIKLKEINNQTININEPTSRKTPNFKNYSPQDLANQYYAAFPSLIPETQNKLVSLIPKWFSSPKKQRQSKMDNSQDQRDQNCDYWNDGNSFQQMNRAQNAAGFYNQEKREDEQQVPESEMPISNFLPDDFLDALEIPKQMTSSLIKEGMQNVDEEENMIKAIWTVGNTGENAATTQMKTYNKAVGGGPWEKLRSIWEYPTAAKDGQTPMDCEDEKQAKEPNLNCFQVDSLLLNRRSQLEKGKKWSEAKYFESELQLDTLVRSIQLLNHDEKRSAFVKVMPGLNFLKVTPQPVAQEFAAAAGAHSVDETEDLYIAARTHFKPIGTPAESSDDEEEVRYPDGMTFPIIGKFVKNAYKERRSDAGNQSLFNFGKNMKAHSSQVLQYIQNQNKMAEMDCDETKNAAKKHPQEVPYQHAMSELHNLIFSDEFTEEGNWKCTCPTLTNTATNMDFSTGNKLAFCPIHLKQSDKLAKIWNNGLNECNKCKRENMDIKKDGSIWKFDPTQREKVESICVLCSHINPDTPSPVPSNSEHLAMDDDDDQLFLDIFTLQKSYAEHLNAQVKYDISELCTNRNLVRQDNMGNPQAFSWSLATQLEHHRMMHINSVPVLHSVTL